MNIITMILAGGTGEELSALTSHRAKTALPFGGRYRIIDFCLSNCINSGLNEISILAQYSPKSLMNHIRMGKPWDLDRKSGGIYILQPTHNGQVANWYLGTADALYQNIDVIRNSKAEMVLVLSGDQVYVMDYRKMILEHQERGKPVTIAIKQVKPSQRSRFGMVRCSPDGLVTSFMEKPASSSYRFASLGIYLFERDFLIDILDPKRIDIVFDIIIPLLEKGEVAGFKFTGYWEDIGSIASYYRASLRLLKHRTMITAREWPIFTRSADLAPAKFFDGSKVMNSIVADGCCIRGEVRNSVLFPGVDVKLGAVVEDSIVFSSSQIGKYTHVKRSIIDKIVSVGGGSKIGLEPRKGADDFIRFHKGAKRNTAGITVIGKGSRLSAGIDIPQGIIIGAHSSIRR